MANSGPNVRMSLEIKTSQNSNIFSNLQLLIVNEFYPIFFLFLSDGDVALAWTSASVAHPLQGPTRCVFGDTVKSYYFSYSCLFISLNQSGQPLPTFLIISTHRNYRSLKFFSFLSLVLKT